MRWSCPPTSLAVNVEGWGPCLGQPVVQNKAHSTPETRPPQVFSVHDTRHSNGNDLPSPTARLGADSALLLLTLVTWVVVEVERVSAVAP